MTTYFFFMDLRLMERFFMPLLAAFLAFMAFMDLRMERRIAILKMCSRNAWAASWDVNLHDVTILANH